MPANRITSVRAELEAERSTVSYAKRCKADANRRERKQAEYVEDFRGAAVAFLDYLRSAPERFFELSFTEGSSATFTQTWTCGAPR